MKYLGIVDLFNRWVYSVFRQRGKAEHKADDENEGKEHAQLLGERSGHML